MKITVFGSGYVGLTTAACLAHVGNHVVCVDINAARIDQLNQGHCPLVESSLPTLLTTNRAADRLEFTTDAAHGITHGEVIFIAVGTPSQADGSAKLDYVIDVARTLGQHLTQYKIIVNKSTVPVGTADCVKKTILQELEKRHQVVAFDVVSNPEFLKEGNAVNDFLKPDRIIIGTDSSTAQATLRLLYAPFHQGNDPLIIMDARSAELTKYAANAMLATRISFINEISQIAEAVGADIEQVRIGIGSDPRIGHAFIAAGCGYGGSCFPKDVQALCHTAKESHYEPLLLSAVHTANERQKHVLFEKIKSVFKNDVNGKRFALWGLAFKPNTDDVRDAPSRVLLEALWTLNASVSAFDPAAMTAIQAIYGPRPDLILCESMEETLEQADALIIVTEWAEFRHPDFDLLKQKLKQPIIFDGRNLYSPHELQLLGFRYYSIGRNST